LNWLRNGSVFGIIQTNSSDRLPALLEAKAMGVPTSPNARLFYRCALQRFEEAKILRKADQLTTGAVYLAGYSVECMLKALILSELTKPKQEAMLKSFRGSKAHDFTWLREQYLLNGGARFPSKVSRCFTLVSDWSTDLRYIPKNLKTKDIDEFLKAAEEIQVWIAGRL
jgi:hypothetical protein